MFFFITDQAYVPGAVRAVEGVGRDLEGYAGIDQAPLIVVFDFFLGEQRRLFFHTTCTRVFDTTPNG